MRFQLLVITSYSSLCLPLVLSCDLSSPLSFLTLSCKDQLARVSLLSGILFITLGLGSDGAPPMLQSRTPPSSITSLPNLPMSLSGYSYMLLKLGPLQFTRKGLSVGSTAACLTFIVSLFATSRFSFFYRH